MGKKLIKSPPGAAGAAKALLINMLGFPLKMNAKFKAEF